MHIHVATPDTPPPPYWERMDDAQSAIVEFVASGNLYHIEDPTGQNRRIAEGWTSLGGADWEDEDVPPHTLLDAVEAYARKNPVILWDHQRDKPIGELLEWEVTEKGLFVRFRIFDERDFDDPKSELLALCNQTWSLLRRGLVRGLSWDGRARKRWVWSDDLGKYIKQPVEVLMSEITVTPIQVHPGAKVTGVNTLSKALRICKALRIGGSAITTGENPMNPKVKAAMDAQAAYAASLADLPDDVELPEELLTNEEGITKALGLGGSQEPPVEPPQENEPPASNPPAFQMPPELQEAITKSLEIGQQNAAAIAALSGEVAPLRNQVAHDDPGANPRPAGGAPSTYERMTKALELGSQVRDGKLNRGQGEPAIVSGPDLMGMHMAMNGMKLDWTGRKPEITFGDGVKRLMATPQ